MTKKRFGSLLLGVVISLVCIFLLVNRIRWKDFFHHLSQVKVAWCLLAVVVYLVGHFLRGIRCSWILRPHCELSYGRATQVVWIGYAANNLLPFRLGEVVRSVLLARKEQISRGISLSTLLVERILDGLAIVGILGFAALYAPSHETIRAVGFFSGSVFTIALAGLVFVRLQGELCLRLLQWGTGLLPESIGSKLLHIGERLLEGTACLKLDRYLVGILGFSLLIWVVEGMMFWVLFFAMGLPPSLIAALLAMSMVNLGVLIPSTPGHTGPFHFFCREALILTAVTTSREIAFGYAVVVHALQYLPVTLLGLWSMRAFGVRLRAIWELGSGEESDETEENKQKSLKAT